MGRRKSKTIPGGYVALPWRLLNHRAYITLPPTAKGMLPYFLGKVKIGMMEHQYYHAQFEFTYTEATHLGCARRTFTRVILDLIDHGFLTPIHWGVKNSSIFCLSRRWEGFGGVDYEPFPLQDFKQRQIDKAVQKWRTTVAKSKPDGGNYRVGEGQK